MDVVLISLAEFTFGLVAGVAAYVAFQNREKPAGSPVFLLLATGCLYAVTNGLSSLLANETATELFALLRWPLGAVISVGVFYTATEYTNRTRFKHNAVLVSMAGFLVLDVVMVFTNGIHEQFLTETAVEDGIFTSTAGPLMTVHLLVSFALVGVGLWFLLIKLFENSLYRRQTATMIVGIGIAAAFFIVEDTLTLHPAFNTATVGIVLGSLVLLWSITTIGLLQTVPVARETLMDSMDAFIVAIDEEDRVIDLNHAARELLGVDDDVLGTPVREILGDYPELLEEFGDETSVESEFTLKRNGQQRQYSLRISPITYSSGFRDTNGRQFIGRLIVVTDVTEQRQRKSELDLLKEVFARVLRHNMRNEMNVIKGNATLLEDRVDSDDDEQAEITQNIVESANEILDLSEKARDLERIIDSSRPKQPIDTGFAIQRAVDEVRQRYPDATITLDIEDGVFASAHQELETAIKNLVENACEHHPDPPATVHLSVSARDDTVDIRVEDDGAGIPNHEIQVIESESETTLSHGSGLGLWIVNWVVNRSDATIDIEADDSGTAVQLTLERTTPPEPEETVSNS
jgi:PAS domain S-box-containing protein